MENLLVFAEQQLVLLIAFVTLVLLFIRYELAKSGHKLTCQQLVQAANTDNALLLDVRDAKDFAAGHITDSINITHTKVNDNIKQLEKYRQRQIVVIDKLGQHAGAVVKILTAHGFRAVRLGGGIAQWQQDNLPLVQ